MRSLRSRAVFAGVIWAILSTLVGLVGLGSFLDDVTLTRFDKILKDRHTQVAIAVANNSGQPNEIGASIADPAFLQPFSGAYFQIESEGIPPIVSQSLADRLLPELEETSNNPLYIDFDGPTGEPVRGINQVISLDDGSAWHVRVASSTEALTADRRALRENILIAIGFIGIVGVLSAILQVSATLRPIDALRKDLLVRWENNRRFEPNAFPSEVAPLVDDINALLGRNREVLSRSRRQAADLAHAIKTPAAIIRNELESLKQQEYDMDNAIDAIDRLDALLTRSLARMRADVAATDDHALTDMDTSLGRLSRAFSAMASQQEKQITTDIATGLKVPIDQADLEEIIGNLLDNALKWAASTVHLSTVLQNNMIHISVEDDGPGIRQEDQDAVKRSGHRLDTTQPGTGLGLAIASDLIEAYGGTIKLSRSDSLGGLQACVIFAVSKYGIQDHANV